jgi:hypothetical protein
MKTQRFVVEITTPDNAKPLNAENVIGALDEGFDFPDWRIDAKEVK